MSCATLEVIQFPSFSTADVLSTLVLICVSSICEAIMQYHGHFKTRARTEQILLLSVAHQERITCI